ncbi:energy-coupling factor transporter transmembrane protein EcfT [Niallia circulans]|uniref:Energy-coupling factor transporter transmembrane component T n=2 Tax=Bacillales TaxID=1385 RepID=A0ABV1F2V2_9BACI|nr:MULTISPECIES: energy-coupling factor transporter transmembrane component T [Bacillaceae]MCF2650417.1 energy-coupling factor transporter transmembrane protein EcfT [Niallia circulans]MCM3363348.1 energy-coupling factor transporter transmembrane protein EcfT [Niallia sp. MER TA 168]
MKSNESYLSHLNPAIKLMTHILLMVILMTIQSAFSTLAIWIYVMLLGLMLGGWKGKFLVKVLLPYSVFFVLTFWMLAAFGKGETVVWKWAWFQVTEESIRSGFLISMRMLAFVTIGLLFTTTTNLYELMMSLIHQWKLSPKWAYGMLAGFRCIPMFQSDLAQLKEAHRVRGYKHSGTWKAFFRYAVPLLTQAIRRSEQMAMAMEVRGFTGERDRTYFQKTFITLYDYLYISVMLIVGISLALLL